MNTHNICMKFLLLFVKTIHKTVIALKGFPEDQYLKADTQQIHLVCWIPASQGTES